MCDPALCSDELQTLIDRLDPQHDEVVICHLNDAKEALRAARSGRQTRYTRSGTVVNGVVWRKPRLQSVP